ncbi:hypothetical protein EDC96DRAFT_503709 [Choanephora cucurbitarum]|nr:hypothetical protein EDC96DRAFT_503709 [Choanephora cucurbitarum]
MFPIYFEQHSSPLHCRRVEPQQFGVNDYIQLQLLLAQEQAQRQQAALRKAYEKQQQEQRRLDRAMYKLRVMAEIQRRREEEELAIQAYYATKRQQQRQRWLIQQQKQQEYLRRKQQQEEEENYYQAMIEAHLKEQYALNDMLQKSSKSVQHPQPTSVKSYYHEESDDESDSDTEDRLKALVKLVFDHQEEEKEQEADDDQQQTMTIDDFVDYISKKAQDLDDSEQEETIDEENKDSHEEDDNDHTEEDMMDFEFVQNDESDSMDEESEEEEEDMPVLVKSTDSVRNLVNSLIEESNDDDISDKEITFQDPVKLAKLDALNRIEQELKEVRQKHEDHILHGTLSFPQMTQIDRAISPEILSASSAENKEFLGYEDQIMKLLLKLDTVESDGDEEIRSKRKTLVKQAEDMLHTLDEFKQKEWERVSCSSQSDHSEDDF